MAPLTKSSERCVSFYQSVIISSFFNIIKNHIIWQALVSFLLFTSLLLGYNQEIISTTEHLSLQRPNNSQLMTSCGQCSVGGEVSVHLLRCRHLSTCGCPSKTLNAKKSISFSRKRTFFERINRI